MKTTWKFFALFCILAIYLYWVDSHRATAKIAETSFAVEVSDPVIPKISVPVYTLKPTGEKTILNQEINPLPWFGTIPNANDGGILEPLASTGLNGGTTPDPLVTFEGLGADNLVPPDPVGDVGPNHYVQMVNVSFQIWDKGDPDNSVPPSILQPDTPLNLLFTELDEPCATQNDGNPIVLYDDQADRWLLSQFAVLGDAQSLCVAISTSSNPMETYYLYEFPMPGPSLDAPKLSAWHDAYYVGTSSGVPNGYYAHALERTKMLAGLSATRQSFLDIANFVIPADADGQLPPPVDEPGIFYTMYAEDFESHPPGVDRLAVYEFHVDWETPENSTFTLASESPIADFNYTVCGFSFASEGCIPQPNTSQTLDARSNWPMFRFQYRNLGNFASLVGNFTVDVSGENQAGIRWFELRKTDDTYTLYQEGTYAPDADHRWIGSIAMDASGNIALGYNVSSETTLPSIRYTSRLVSDPPGTLSTEAELLTGTGIQTGTMRWGDYSNLVVDPIDGCHFWFTAPYHDEDDSGFNWNTRVGVFKIPTCGGNTGTLTGQVTDGISGLSGVDIQARGFITQTGSTTTAENGSYAVSLSEGTYVITATAYGYLPSVATGVDIISGTTTLQNFALVLAPVHLITGTVYDAVTGWPLYAEISISDYPNNPIWSNPETGEYQVMLPEGIYAFEVSTWEEGYIAQTLEVAIESEQMLDFPMEVNAVTCNTPGYVFNGTVIHFDEETIPPGWFTIDDLNANPTQVWRFDDPLERGNLTGGTGPFAIADSDFYGPGEAQDTWLFTTTSLDFSNLSSVHLAFDTDFKVWDGNLTNEKGDVDVSIDGGETWINVWRREMEDGNYNGHVDVDISQYAANEPEILFRFRYYDASFDWWWQVDNIAYGALTCDAMLGGLVVGNAYDANFNTPLNDVTVSLSSVLSTSTQPTPADPGVDEGFFSLFAPQGIYTLTASFPNYGAPTYPLTTTNGTTTRQNIFLPAGWLISEPNSLTLSLGFGYSATLPLRWSNLGAMSTTFIISPTQGHRTEDILWLTFSPLTGTLSANSTLDGQLIFSAMTITETGVYSANLIIENDTPYGELNLPVTLIVGPPTPSIIGSPDQTGVGMPGSTIHYSVTITNTGNIPEWFDISITDELWESTSTIANMFLNPGAKVTFEVYITIPITASYLEEDTTTVVVVGSSSGVTTSVHIRTIAQYPFLQFLPFILIKE